MQLCRNTIPETAFFPMDRETFFQPFKFILECHPVCGVVRDLSGDNLHGPYVPVQQVNDLHSGLVFRIGMYYDGYMKGERTNV